MCELVLNFHLTKKCNMKCVYCFGKYKESEKNVISVNDWLNIAKNAQSYAKDNDFSGLRITLAGGEPTIYENFEDLVNLFYSNGINISLITNGAVLNNYFDEFLQKFSMIGVSIDSLSKNINHLIGREANQIMNYTEYEKICLRIKKLGITLKINTVVSKLNCSENFTEFINEMKPDKWKVLKMLILEGENDKFSKNLKVTEREWDNFLTVHKSIKIFTEEEKELTQSYLTVTNSGQLCCYDKNGNIRNYTDFLTKIDFANAVKQSGFDKEIFSKRYDF